MKESGRRERGKKWGEARGGKSMAERDRAATKERDRTETKERNRENEGSRGRGVVQHRAQQLREFASVLTLESAVF
eukprot:766437-Rhodomonas_salina.5